MLQKCLTLLAFLCSNLIAIAQCPTLVWSDEFDGDGVNAEHWSFQIGASGWGNNEWQYYRPENATVGDGTLKITAKREGYEGASFTSTRMRTINKADFTYGRFEARIKMTYGQGIWPAFWMMPTDDVYGGWPKSGEIDIMENLGYERDRTHGTIHFGQNGHQYSGSSFQLVGGARFSDGFHVFAVEKEPNEIRWYVDDVLYMVQTADGIAPEFWPFEERYHFILNVAVGGNWPGYPDDTTVFPQVLEVDYVRVYDMGFPSIGGPRIVSNRASDKVYRLDNVPEHATIEWSLPPGARITKGKGTSSITVLWGDHSGAVTAAVTSPCGTTYETLDVVVKKPVAYQFSFENFDDSNSVTLIQTSGSLTQTANPDTGGINTSAQVGSYVRNAGAQYDVMVFNTTTIPDAAAYANGTLKIFMDVYTTAPAGTEVLLQVEDPSKATGTNYPEGRHSRYQVFTTIQNGWERLEFNAIDQPDGSVDPTKVTAMVLLFAPNSNTGDTWLFDNFDSYRTLPIPQSRRPAEQRTEEPKTATRRN